MISNYGRVKSLARTIERSNGVTQTFKERMLKFNFNKSGYIHIHFSSLGIKKSFYLHRLVAEAFIQNPEGKPQVNHIDGNKCNNKVSNLEWNTHTENTQHAFDIGLNIQAKGTKAYWSKFNEQDILDIRASKLTYRKLGEIYNVSSGVISRIKNNQTYII